MYVTGGWDVNGNPIAQTDVYDPSTDRLEHGGSQPESHGSTGSRRRRRQDLPRRRLRGLVLHALCSLVSRYDPGADSWDSVASYPTTDSWESCGGINGLVYCSGGVSGGTTFSSGNVFDPGSDSWSPIADMPIDLWGSASGAANGTARRLERRDAAGSTRSRTRASRYDPSADSWTALPNAQFPRYRAGGSCGFYKVGGSSAGFSPIGGLREAVGTRRVRRASRTCHGSRRARQVERSIRAAIRPSRSRSTRTGWFRATSTRPTLTFRTNSGRRPNLAVPVRLIVPRVGPQLRRRRLHERRRRAVVGRSGVHGCQPGGVRPVSRQKTASTRSAIGGTLDDPLYQDARISPMTYRITGLPPAVYRLELKFAEIQNKKSGPAPVRRDRERHAVPDRVRHRGARRQEQRARQDDVFVSVPSSGEITVQLANAAVATASRS